jgi:uncharacterized protein (DUF1697 family)
MSATTFIALLRGINVGGHQKVAMADLRALAAGLGFADPRSVLQSGNLVFQAGARPTGPLEQRLERETEKRLHLQTDFIIRTGAEWKAVIARNPFPEPAARDPSHLVVVFFKDPPKAADVAALQAAIAGREVFRADGRQAYITYPDGIGDSRLTNALIERTLRVRGTARNWNTVMKLGALAGP